MNIFAYACEPNSWCKLLGIDSTMLMSTLKQSTDPTSGLFYGDAINVTNIKRFIPTKKLEIPVSGDHLFFKWGYR